jgi:CheY-like chemotaxis protein
VLSAADAHEALRVSAEYQSPIDLLLTDVIMSGPSGPRLAETLVGLRPELAVLFMSGYNEDTIVRQGVLRQGVAYLQKPFKPAGLLRRVRDTLDRQPAAARAAV